MKSKLLIIFITITANVCLSEPCLRSDIRALDVLSKTLYYEARGEGERGIRAVASTIYNRALIKNGIADANSCVKQALRRKQYSCWNGRDNLSAGRGKSWQVCREVAYEMVIGEFLPTTIHTHYYAHKKVNPYWARDAKKVKIGRHTFLTVRW